MSPKSKKLKQMKKEDDFVKIVKTEKFELSELDIAAESPASQDWGYTVDDTPNAVPSTSSTSTAAKISLILEELQGLRKEFKCQQKELKQVKKEVAKVYETVTSIHHLMVENVEKLFGFRLPLATVEDLEACEEFISSRSNWLKLKNFLDGRTVNADNQTKLKQLFANELFNCYGFCENPGNKLAGRVSGSGKKVFSTFLDEYLTKTKETPDVARLLTRHAYNARRRMKAAKRKLKPSKRTHEEMEETEEISIHENEVTIKEEEEDPMAED